MHATIEEQLEHLMETGFVIVRDMIPADELEQLRTSVDRIVERATESGVQGRVDTTEWVEPETANAVEFFFDERTLGFSRDLMGAPAATPSGMWVLVGSGTGWHRDIHPIDMAPLDGLQEDILSNGPPYLQWHIALYDDNFLHVIPGSHRRRNNAEESKIERSMGVVQLPGATQVDLKAGDGVVYINCFLHSATPNVDIKRRTFHGGYHCHGNDNFTHFMPQTIGDDFVENLSARSAAHCEEFTRLFAERLDHVVKVFRAMIDQSEPAFRDAFDQLHHSPDARMTSVVVLARIAQTIRTHKNSDDQPNTGTVKELGARFPAEELDLLWDRFGRLEEELTAEEEQYEPLFQNRPMHYYFYEMPQDFDFEDFIASWV